MSQIQSLLAVFWTLINGYFHEKLVNSEVFRAGYWSKLSEMSKMCRNCLKQWCIRFAQSGKTDKRTAKRDWLFSKWTNRQIWHRDNTVDCPWHHCWLVSGCVSTGCVSVSVGVGVGFFVQWRSVSVSVSSCSDGQCRVVGGSGVTGSSVWWYQQWCMVVPRSSTTVNHINHDVHHHPHYPGTHHHQCTRSSGPGTTHRCHTGQ